jgi:uncharacterized membrane protein
VVTIFLIYFILVALGATMFLTILLIIHVMGVIIWIGGVAFVTTVIFPLMYQTGESLEKGLLFQRVEHRFASMVRWLISIVGITGFWLLYAEYGFGVLAQKHGFGILIMIFAWALYAGILLSERKIFGKLFADPEKNRNEQRAQDYQQDALGIIDHQLFRRGRRRLVRT